MPGNFEKRLAKLRKSWQEKSRRSISLSATAATQNHIRSLRVNAEVQLTKEFTQLPSPYERMQVFVGSDGNRIPNSNRKSEKVHSVRMWPPFPNSLPVPWHERHEAPS
jgi:hypothetical protein